MRRRWIEDINPIQRYQHYNNRDLKVMYGAVIAKRLDAFLKLSNPICPEHNLSLLKYIKCAILD